jgi:hypothetical protein
LTFPPASILLPVRAKTGRLCPRKGSGRKRPCPCARSAPPPRIAVARSRSPRGSDRTSRLLPWTRTGARRVVAICCDASRLSSRPTVNVIPCCTRASHHPRTKLADPVSPPRTASGGRRSAIQDQSSARVRYGMPLGEPEEWPRIWRRETPPADRSLSAANRSAHSAR